MAAHRAEPVMPPKEKKDETPLTPEELGLIKLWIDAGAKDDSDRTRSRPSRSSSAPFPPASSRSSPST